jgi:hypothetical protein
MLQISISSELAAEHPRFVAECAGRGHTIEVFGPHAENSQAPAEGTGTGAPPERSGLIDLGHGELAAQIDRPAPLQDRSA